MRYIILITYLSYLNPCLLTKLSIVFQNSGLQMVLAYSTLLSTTHKIFLNYVFSLPFVS